MATDRSATGAGRPSKRYTVTARTTGLEFAVRHDDLLVTLLGKTLARLPDGEAEALAEEVGAEYGRAMAATAAASGHDVSGDDMGRSFRAALHTVADALTAHGFAAHAESRDGRLRIISEHCPFGDAAIEHPVICAVDRGMVRGMLAALVRRRVGGDGGVGRPRRRCLRHRRRVSDDPAHDDGNRPREPDRRRARPTIRPTTTATDHVSRIDGGAL